MPNQKPKALHAIDAILEQAPWFKFNYSPLEQPNGLFLERAAIIISAQLADSDQHFKFQLDTGAPVNLLYEISATEQLPKELSATENKLPSTLTLQFDGKFQTAVKFKILENFGEYTDSSNNFPNIGTLGLDFFSNVAAGFGVDYKKQQIYCLSRKLLDSISAHYPDNFLDYLDTYQKMKNKILLHFNIEGIEQLAIFDTGSSLFELVVPPDQWQKITGCNIDDSFVNKRIEGMAWGKPLTAFGVEVEKYIHFSMHLKRLRTIYTMVPSISTLPVIGNALFFNDVIVLDLVNKKFGLFQDIRELIPA